MPGNGEQRMRDGASALQGPVRPGALTELLAELARAPEGAGWDAPLLPGQRVGRFEILREVGRGGFGVVYEARDTELSRSVAFKAVRSSGGDSAREARLLAEAEAAARLAHPNIVHLYDVGRCPEGPYLILELLQGRTLAEKLEEGPLPLREAVRVAVEVARGLSHAHAQGVIHRDVKPGNVFLCEDGQVKVLDFGLAHVFGRGGAAGGTPAYMAPEQAKGEAGDARADVYSLGVVLEELRTGRRPEAGAGATPKAAGRRARADRALARLAAEMRSADPALRPADAGAALQPLLAIQRSLEPRRALWAGLAVALLAVAGAAAFAYAWQRPLPEGRLLTALADTDNRTGDAHLDGVSELLRAGLEQSRRLSLMARSRLVNALWAGGARPPAALDEAAARTAGAHEQAQLLLVPAVQRTGSGYEISIRAVELPRNVTRFAVRETAWGQATVYAALDRAVSDLRRRLRETPGQAPLVPVAVADVAPASPEALRLYAEGMRLSSEGWPEEALEAFRKSVTADPDFLLPRLRALDLGIRFDLLEEYQRVLRENLHRLPAQERAHAEAFGLLAPVDEVRNMTEYLASLDRYIEAWPEDPRPYEEAGNLLLMQRADLEAARPYLEKAVAIAPLAEGAAIDFLLALGRLDEALARARRWTEEHPGWLSFNNLHLAHQHRGEFRESIEALRRSLAFPGPGEQRRPPFLVAFANDDAIEAAEDHYRRLGRRNPSWLALRGRVREALAAYAALAPPAGDADRHIDHVFFRSYLTLPLGDPEATWRQAEALFQVGYPFFDCHALQLALLGDQERALPLSRSRRAHDGQICHRTHMAVREWKRGDRDAALRSFAAIWAHSSHLYRGQILIELGRHREGVEEIRTYRRQRGISIWDGNFDAWNYPRSLYFEAAALEALGERDESRRVLGRLLRLWERPDPGLPLLADIRALQKRLAAGGGSP